MATGLPEVSEKRINEIISKIQLRPGTILRSSQGNNHQPSKNMSEDNQSPMNKPGHFSWNELVTTDEAAAKTFYTGLLGWTTQAFGEGMDYTLLKKGDTMVGGLMKCPQPGMPAQWLAYVTVEDVDATSS